MAVIALLECGHYTSYGYESPIPNPTGPEENCPEGCGYQLINNEWREQWRVDCSQADCRYHTRHGFRKRSAVESAQDHRLRTGHHCSVRWYSDAPSQATQQLRQRSRERQQKKLSESLPIPLAPPF